MIFSLNYSDHSAKHQSELRQWYYDNGLVFSSLGSASLVDPVAGTVTVHSRVVVEGQEDLDFPEFVTDDNGRPVTLEQVVPLTVMPLPWMLTMTGAGPREPARAPSLAGV